MLHDLGQSDGVWDGGYWEVIEYELDLSPRISGGGEKWREGCFGG